MFKVYKCSNPGLGVRVYFMMYSDSVEEQRYLSGLRREKNAFERLIREKSVRPERVAIQGNMATHHSRTIEYDYTDDRAPKSSTLHRKSSTQHK